MENSKATMEKIVNLCKNRGFIFPGSEIYGGLYGAADGYNMLSNVLAGWVIFGLCLISGFVINLIKTKKQVKEEKTWDEVE